MAARGRGGRSQYRKDARPLGQSTHAIVWRAKNKATGDVVALKSVLGRSPDAIARMAREIEVGQRFGLDSSIMPVLDAASDKTWFTMPLAVGDAEALWPRLGPDVELLRVLDALTVGLGAAHAVGYVHRDIKPSNVLMLPNGQWVVADWGLVRRPRGETSLPGRTATGTPFGTFGFAAPELSMNAHNVTSTVDVYSVGQLVGWARTGQHPQPNIPLLPDEEPWRTLVRRATLFDPGERPTSVDQLRDLLGPVEDRIGAAERQAQDLLRRAMLGTSDAARTLVALAVTHAANDGVLRVVARLGDEATRAAVRADPATAARLARSIAAMGDRQVELPYGARSAIASFTASVLDTARRSGHESLREEAERAFTAWESALDADVRKRFTRPADRPRAATWLRRARPAAQADGRPTGPAMVRAGHDTMVEAQSDPVRPRVYRRGRYAAALAAVLLVTAVVEADSIGLRPRSGAEARRTPQPSGVTPTSSLTPTPTPSRSSSPKPTRTPSPTVVGTSRTSGPPVRAQTPTVAPTTSSRTVPVSVRTTIAPPALPKPCWKYDADYYNDPDRQDYVAPIGTAYTQSFYQLDQYVPRVNIVRVNSNCSEATVFVSNAGDERSFPSFVGQQWVLFLAEDFYIDGELVGHRGDRMWNDTAGRRNFSSMNNVPDGYDAQPIPPCC